MLQDKIQRKNLFSDSFFHIKTLSIKSYNHHYYFKVICIVSQWTVKCVSNQHKHQIILYLTKLILSPLTIDKTFLNYSNAKL